MNTNNFLFQSCDKQDKPQIRKWLRQRRQTLNQSERKQAEQATNRYLKKMIKRNQRIAVYWAYGSELKLDMLIQAAQKRKAQLYLPYIEARCLRLWFTPYPKQKSTKSKSSPIKHPKSGIRIPQFHGKKIRAEHLHTLFIPIVGIDRHGIRLGQGGGYYDSTLAACKHKRLPKTVAVAFACQTVDTLPSESHDIAVQKLICEFGIFRLPIQ